MKNALVAGLEAIKSHSKLWMILWLIVIFPVVFLYAFYNIHSASSDNVRSLELRRISTLHDTIEALLITKSPVAEILPSLVPDDSDLVALKVATESRDGLTIIADAEPEYVGQQAIDTRTYRLALLQPGETYIARFETNGRMLDHAYRYLTTPDGGLVIFSAHDFTDLQTVLSTRTFYSTFALFAIFIFIIGLAYWVANQINYQALFARAKDTLKERDLFANSLAHELRSPVTAIKGYASIMKEGESSPESKKYIETIEISADRLLALINDFLEAARIQSGALPLALAPVDVLGVVNKTVTELSQVAAAKNLKLETRLPFEAILMTTDEKRLSQVLTNIISNSIKYTKAGTVTVSVMPKGTSVVCTIADTGFGISAEDQRKLFAPFARVGDSSQQQEITGTGLGMWITKQLISQLGGTIEIESIKGVGTHVIITLPLHHAE
jgi:signal transduction histidine kinase